MTWSNLHYIKSGEGDILKWYGQPGSLSSCPYDTLGAEMGVCWVLHTWEDDFLHSA